MQSHGSGEIILSELAACGQGVVFEPGAMVFHPENIELGDRVYVGHYAILKGYHRNKLIVGDDSWIGKQVFMHAAGGIDIGRRVGIGPGAKILTSRHQLPDNPRAPIMDGALEMAPVVLGDGCDIGVGAIILPGVRIGVSAQIGAGAVVTSDIPDGAIAMGVPARVTRIRG